MVSPETPVGVWGLTLEQQPEQDFPAGCPLPRMWHVRLPCTSLLGQASSWEGDRGMGGEKRKGGGLGDLELGTDSGVQPSSLSSFP